MSKYNDLQQLATKAGHKTKQFRNECIECVRDFYKGLQCFLGCSSEELKIYPLSKDTIIESKKHFTPKGACEFNKDSSCCEFGVALIFDEYRLVVFFPINVMDSNGNLTLEFGNKKHSVNKKGRNKDFTAFYDFIFQTIRDLLEGEQTTGTIGFNYKQNLRK